MIALGRRGVSQIVVDDGAHERRPSPGPHDDERVGLDERAPVRDTPASASAARLIVEPVARRRGAAAQHDRVELVLRERGLGGALEMIDVLRIVGVAHARERTAARGSVERRDASDR